MNSKDKQLNEKQRMEAVEKWANYVVEHDDWSEQQKVLIDSQIENPRIVGLTKEQVEYIRTGKKQTKTVR